MGASGIRPFSDEEIMSAVQAAQPFYKPKLKTMRDIGHELRRTYTPDTDLDLLIDAAVAKCTRGYQTTSEAYYTYVYFARRLMQRPERFTNVARLTPHQRPSSSASPDRITA